MHCSRIKAHILKAKKKEGDYKHKGQDSAYFWEEK